MTAAAACTLLADIGGTNARFACYTGGQLHNPQVLQCAEFADVPSAVRHYLAMLPTPLVPTQAVLAVAAPIRGDHIAITNNHWRFSIAQLQQTLGLQQLRVLNDFTALALGLRDLPAADLRQMGGQQAVPGAPMAVIGPGTGLGISGLLPGARANDPWVAVQGEGGHATLAAVTDREQRVFTELRKRYAHVSAERLLSGPGLVLLYQTLCTLDQTPALQLAAAQVSHAALRQENAQCVQALSMFCALLGGVTGNLALTLGALGGVYIGGGIVPRLGEFVAKSELRERFESKGRYVEYLRPIPIHVIHTEHAAFFGLMAVARGLG
jgi:glucokinase